VIDRLAELSANLAAVRSQIAMSAAAVDRDPAEITLIAVTKTFPVSDILLLSRLGVADIGENRDADAAPKAAACAAAGVELRWHFVGQLQVNKAARVAAYADVVHSVDRIRLAEALGRRAVGVGRVIGCLVQVSLDEPGPAGRGGRDVPDGTGRGGADPAEVPEVAAAIAAEPSLRLAGVMGIAPLGEPARPAYARLRELADAVRAAHPDARVISAGMTADMGEAIAEGATHVRIGTALLGGRRPFVR
jgi:PLP dependent protein